MLCRKLLNFQVRCRVDLNPRLVLQQATGHTHVPDSLHIHTSSSLLVTVLLWLVSGHLRLGCMARDKGQIYDASDWFKMALQIDQVFLIADL